MCGPCLERRPRAGESLCPAVWRLSSSMRESFHVRALPRTAPACRRKPLPRGLAPELVGGLSSRRMRPVSARIFPLPDVSDFTSFARFACPPACRPPGDGERPRAILKKSWRHHPRPLAPAAVITHFGEEKAMEKKLQWLCRRGMKELDILFTAYLENDYPNAACEERRAFVELLGYQDPRIVDLLFGRRTDADPAVQALIAFLRTSRESGA